MYRQMYFVTDRQDRYTDRQTDRFLPAKKDKRFVVCIVVHACKEDDITHRHTDRQTDTQTDRQTDRQTHRHTD